MKTGLPVEIDPIQLADQGARLIGELPGAAFSRLRQECAAPLDPVRLDLAFVRGADGLRKMAGTASVECELICQRCLEPMIMRLEAVFQTVFYRMPEDHQQGEATSDEMDSIIVEGPVRLSGLVEDELLLAVPMMPMHDKKTCSATRYLAEDAPANGTSLDRQNPFAVLDVLKAKDDQ
ncbi:MAG: YceD family protein [Gammaproteobacteria bacterium]|nr:YceD family protein [Gammaproteobacteria bacterium]